MTRLIIFCAPMLLCLGRAANQPFIVEPYLQMGNAPQLASSDSIALMWHAADVDERWDVQTKPPAGTKWSAPLHASFTRVAVRGVEPHRVYSAKLSDLTPGEEFYYRVLRGDQSVFESHSRARKTKDQSYRVAIFGDCAAGTPEQRAVAYQVYQAHPDFVLIPGDIVYSRGRIGEYRKNYFPVYNAATASPDSGAPLLRSTLFIAAPGNHDIAAVNLTTFPDQFAYFLYWSQPLNGPLTKVGAKNTPPFIATDEEKKAFLAAAEATYPRMANFSFDYGNAHWTVLDSNPTVDWSDNALRDWLMKDIAAAKSATWRFVSFHHPGFNSSRTHFIEQRMRRMSEVFEASGVDIVFAGHVHNYQRSFPMRFKTKPNDTGVINLVNGEWTLDKKYDGGTNSKPNGIIYLVTGAGGARRYNPEQEDHAASWQPFTDKFVSTVNSFTQMDVNGRKLTISQISQDGKEADHFVVTK